MQRIQTYLTKGFIPQIKIMDKTLQSDSGESEELFDLAMDSFNLLAFSHRDLSSQRRRLLAPAIANKYKQLKVKEIDDSRKLGSKINLNVQPSTSQQRYKTGASFNRTGGYRQYKPQFKSSHSSDKRQFKLVFTKEGPEPADHKEPVQESGAGPSEEINKNVSSKFVCLHRPDNFVAGQIQYFLG